MPTQGTAVPARMPRNAIPHTWPGWDIRDRKTAQSVTGAGDTGALGGAQRWVDGWESVDEEDRDLLVARRSSGLGPRQPAMRPDDGRRKRLRSHGSGDDKTRRSSLE